MTQAYPLQWPAGKPRTAYPTASAFGNRTVDAATKILLIAIERLGGANIIISTNQKIRRDGLPYSNQPQPKDTGVAIYFTYQKTQRCFACDSWEKMQDNIYAIAKTIDALRGIARWGSGDMVMQNLVIVHGRPTWSSQFLIATVNSCGRFSALRYEFFGERGTDGWGCRAWAIEKATGEKLVGTDVTIKLAKDEGWYGKSGSKWKTMPQQMLMYRSGSWWTRAYAPELSMGLHTVDEMRDVWDAEKQEDGTFAVTLDNLRPEAASPEQTPHDPVTGEILEEVAAQNAEAATADIASNAEAKQEAPPEQPRAIPVKPLPTDSTKADFESWSYEWARMCSAMHDAQSLEKLRKLNEAPLGNMARIDPETHNWCMTAYTERMVLVGGV